MVHPATEKAAKAIVSKVLDAYFDAWDRYFDAYYEDEDGEYVLSESEVDRRALRDARQVASHYAVERGVPTDIVWDLFLRTLRTSRTFPR